MSLQKSKSSLAIKAYSTAWQTVKNSPAVIIPFLIFTAIQLIVLTFLFLIPRMPLRPIFGPIIRTLWNESFLHYPANFLLLPKLGYLSGAVLSVIIGSLLTAMAVAMISDVYNKKHANLGIAFKTALKRYIPLFIIVFIFITLFYFLTKFIFIGLAKYFLSGHKRFLFLHSGIWMGPLLIIINFIVGLFIQAACVYAIPVLIIEKTKIIKSIVKSILLFKRMFITTLIIAGLPLLLYIPIVILTNNTALLIDKFFPEFILWVLYLGTVINSLIIDAAITLSATSAYFIYSEKGQGNK